MRFHNNRSGGGQAARKARALDEVAVAIARHLRPDGGSRQELISRLVRIIEARTNYVFLGVGRPGGRDAAFHMTAGERQDGPPEMQAQMQAEAPPPATSVQLR